MDRMLFHRSDNKSRQENLGGTAFLSLHPQRLGYSGWRYKRKGLGLKLSWGVPFEVVYPFSIGIYPAPSSDAYALASVILRRSSSDFDYDCFLLKTADVLDLAKKLGFSTAAHRAIALPMPHYHQSLRLVLAPSIGIS